MNVELKLEGDSVRVTALDCRSLEAVAGEVAAGMRVWLDRTEAVPHIRDLLAKERPGKGHVTLVPRLDAAQAVEITLPARFPVGPRLVEALMGIPGVERVEQV